MNIAEIVDRAIEIIRERAAQTPGAEWDEELTRWCLDGICFREGEEAAMEFARTAPFHIKKPQLVGYA